MEKVWDVHLSYIHCCITCDVILPKSIELQFFSLGPIRASPPPPSPLILDHPFLLVPQNSNCHCPRIHGVKHTCHELLEAYVFLSSGTSLEIMYVGLM